MSTSNITDNVNQDEINKFADLSEEWWDPAGKMRPLHLINPMRLRYIQQHADITGQRILDVGCGGGLLSEALAQSGAQVTAVDMSAELITVAKQHAEQNQLSIDYQCQNIETFAAHNIQAFDILTCMELLEHVPDPKRMITACAQCIKPNGKLFFSTINRNYKAFLLAIVGAEYLLNWLPKGTHQYGSLIQPAELVRWATAANLKLINLTGMRYALSTQQFELCDDLSVNYLACFSAN